MKYNIFCGFISCSVHFSETCLQVKAVSELSHAVAEKT